MTYNPTTLITDAQIASSAAIAQSKIANLTTALGAKAASSVTLTGTNSITGGGDLSANRTLSLVNDAATPGASTYYGTNGSGTKGFYGLPAVSASNSFGVISDGTNSSAADQTNDTFRLRSSDNKLTITVANDDPTYGDSALFAVNEANLNPANFTINPLARANHTGTQTAATISDFTEAAQDATAAAFAAGNHTGVSVTYNDAANSISLAATGASPTAETVPAGTTFTMLKSGSTWPARPTARTDVVVQWKGADPSPAIVSSGTGGMLNNVDIRLVTP